MWLMKSTFCVVHNSEFDELVIKSFHKQLSCFTDNFKGRKHLHLALYNMSFSLNVFSRSITEGTLRDINICVCVLFLHLQNFFSFHVTINAMWGGA